MIRKLARAIFILLCLTAMVLLYWQWTSYEAGKKENAQKQDKPVTQQLDIVHNGNSLHITQTIKNITNKTYKIHLPEGGTGFPL